MRKDFDYTPIPQDRCYELATSLASEGKKVHFHVLSPGCCLNPFSNLYSFVIEDRTDKITYLSRSEKFPEVNNKLLSTQYDDTMLDETISRLDEKKFIEESIILKKTIELVQAGKDWHHHVFPPDCIFNPNEGFYTIAVEQVVWDSHNEIETEVFNEEPRDIIREIEILYFKGKGK